MTLSIQNAYMLILLHLTSSGEVFQQLDIQIAINTFNLKLIILRNPNISNTYFFLISEGFSRKYTTVNINTYMAITIPIFGIS